MITLFAWDFHGVLEVLQKIIDNGHKNILISNREHPDAKNFIKLVGLEKYFTGDNLIAEVRPDYVINKLSEVLSSS